MKAAVIEHAGDSGALKDIPVPAPRQGELLVQISAAGVNPVDWKVRDSGKRPMPFVLGQDFAGAVSAVGEGVTHYKQGDRVFGIAREHGSYAEYTVVPENDRSQPIAIIPDGVSDLFAAALPTAGLTALAGIEHLRVGSTSVLLVLGATGGVGSFAVQLAHERGAHVIGTARSANYTLARQIGVDDFVAYDHGDVVAAVQEARPEGVDAVLDLVSDGEQMKRIAVLVKPGGSVVSTIGSADVPWFSSHGMTASNLVVMQTPQSSTEGLAQLARLVAEKRLRITIAAERTLGEAEAALVQSKTGMVDGKIVLTV